MSSSKVDFRLGEYISSVKNILGDIDFDDAVKAFQKLGVNGDDLVDVLKKCGFEADEISEKLKSVGKSGASNIGTTNKLKTAYTGLAASIGISTTALTAFLAVAAGIAVAVAAVKMYNQYIQECVDNAKIATSAWSENNSTIEAQIERINELKTALDNGTLSEQDAYDAKAELYSIQTQLVETYGGQASGIDLVNGKLQEQIDLVRELSAAEADRILNSNKTGIDEAVRQMTEEKTYNLGTVVNSNYANLRDDQMAAAQALDEVLKEYENVLDVKYNTNSPTRTISFTGNVEDAEEVINNFMSDVREKARELGDSSLFEGILNTSSGTLNDVNEVLANYQGLYEEAMRANLVSDRTEYTFGDIDQTAVEWMNDYTEAVERYNDALASGDSDAIADAAAEFNNVDTAIQSLLESGAFEGYEDVFADILEQLNEAAIAKNNFTAELTKDSGLAASYAERLKELGVTDIDLKASLSSDGIQEGEVAFRGLIGLASQAGIEIDDLIALLVELGYVSGQSTTVATDGLSSIKEAAAKAATATETVLSGITGVQDMLGSQTTGTSISLADFDTAALNGYSEALEYNNGALQLNAEKVNALIQAKADEQIVHNDIAKAVAQSEYLQNAAEIEQLRDQLNALGEDEVDAKNDIQSKIDALISENNTIRNTCAQYDLMSASLREATSAYQHWINAQSSSQTGDMFDSALSAMQHINDTLNNSESDLYGRIGRTDYKAAVDFIIPDTVDAEDTAAVNSYMDEISNMFTYDSDGNRTGLNIAEFCREATEIGLMELDEASNAYRIAGGKTMEDFASGMELSLPLVQAMFGELQEFGAEFDWADEAVKTLGDLGVAATVAADQLRGIDGNESLKLNLDVSDIEGKENKINALRDTIEEMQGLKEAKLDVDPSQVEYANQIIQYCVAQMQQLEDPAILDVDTTKLSESAAEAVSLIQDFKTAYNELEMQKTLGLDTTEAQAKVDSLREQIASSDNAYLVSLELDSSSVEALNSTITGIQMPEIQAVFGIDDSALLSYEAENKEAWVIYGVDHRAVDAYSPANLYRTVYYTYTTTNSPPSGGGSDVNGTAHASGTARASGDWGTAPGGPTLVGELGREIVVDPHTGKWYTVGDRGAEFVNIPTGAIIFNHEQSNSLLEKGYVAGRGHAMASGTAMVSGYIPVTGMWNGGSGSNSGNYGGSGNYHSSQNNQSSEDIAEDAKNAFDEAYAYHQHLLAMEQEDLEHYLRWLEAAYQDAYRNGEIELEDYYKYEEEVYDGRKELFEDYLNDLEHKIEGLEREGGNNGQIINLYLGMINDIKNEIAQARARGLDENDEYIQDLIDQQRDYEDEIADIREEATDDAMGAVEDLVEYRIKMLKQDLENERDALEDKKDALKDFYDKQKEMLQDVYDEEKTLEERNEKRQAKTDIEAELAQLEFDDSAWAQKRKLELQEELVAAQKDLDDFEKEQTLESTQDLLDKMYERQEAQIQTEIDAIEAKLNDPNALYNQALHDIQNNTQALYMEMVEYNNKYGTGNPEDVKNMWDEAKASLDEFLATFGQAYKDIILVASPDGYASGTRSATPGIKKVDEESAEWLFTSGDGTRYRVFSGGEKVLNADATNFLYDFAMSGGQILSNMFSDLLSAFNFNNIGKSSQPIQLSTGDIIIQGNADQRTVSEIRRAQRENIDFVLKEFTRLNK